MAVKKPVAKPAPKVAAKPVPTRSGVMRPGGGGSGTVKTPAAAPAPAKTAAVHGVDPKVVAWVKANYPDAKNIHTGDKQNYMNGEQGSGVVFETSASTKAGNLHGPVTHLMSNQLPQYGLGGLTARDARGNMVTADDPKAVPGSNGWTRGAAGAAFDAEGSTHPTDASAGGLHSSGAPVANNNHSGYAGSNGGSGTSGTGTAFGGGNAPSGGLVGATGNYGSQSSAPSYGSGVDASGSPRADAPFPGAPEAAGAGFKTNENTEANAATQLKDRNAIAALNNLFQGYGLGSLAPKIADYVKQGYDNDTAALLLQDTSEYRERFAGNELRRQKGLAVLSPAEYLSTERAYKDAAQAYGLPKGFYDNASDFAGLIGTDISPTEFSQRAQHAFQFTQSGNGEARDMLRQYYGVDDRHIAAYFLDPGKAQAVIDRASSAADLGGAGLRQGIGVGKDRAEMYVDQGVSQQQAESGFGQASAVLRGGEGAIAARFGQTYDANDATDEFVGGLASAARKRNLLNQQEQNLFAAGEGTTKSFSTDNSGSY